MKFAVRILLLPSLAATFADSQTQNIPQVKHVIIVIQENRTPTNLFQQDSSLIANGAHIVSSLQVNDQCGNSKGFPLQATGLFTCWDTFHNHTYPTADWVNMWDKGKMDGACQIGVGWTGNGVNNCGGTPTCISQIGPPWNQNCSYTFVANDQASPEPGILNPYFQIAGQFGYANYMFQTNQGPSFPAHQFLLSGSSAPTGPADGTSCNYGTHNLKCYQWFDAENAVAHGGYGCTSTSANIYEIDPFFDNEQGIYNNGFPCYDRPTLVDLLDGASPSLSWKYYARSTASLWSAPDAIQHICQPTGGGNCLGQDWLNNVQPVLPDQGNYTNDSAPILTDIKKCNLSAVSWVIPDGNWSDHAGGNPANVKLDGGPSWVAAIVNQVGQATGCDNNAGYWSDTVILVVWDDWGGYYDDVAPPDCQTNPCTGYSNGTGQQYVYGFRVPMLVVGAYAIPGYISGAKAGAKPDCQHNTYCHDFGSILNFIEYAFGTGGKPLGFPGGIAGLSYPYADWLVMDQGQAPNNYSLYDFFNFSKENAFQTINGAKYPPDCFHHPRDSGCFKVYPTDPDNDAIEAD